uniref:Rho GTPase-activating protein 32 n=1 Tax=Astatotilapia calliptera TaxID=8154 RepID=A0AAX7UZH6_ASTCA
SVKPSLCRTSVLSFCLCVSGCRGLRPGRHLEDDDLVPELAHIHPRERPDWEETISAMARSAEIPELRTEPLMRSCSSSTASMKVKNVKKLCFTKGHFPKLAECAHFHYENVDFGTIQLSLGDEQSEVTRNGYESKELVYLVHIYCQGRSWIVKRSYEDFRVLDKHLHLCIYDRRFSQLPELPRLDSLTDQSESVSQMLLAYLSRLSAIADNKINCGPALTWMEVDNKGNHLLVHEESSINVPAIAAAHVIKRYTAQASDELSFEVGDIVSVIDMPPKEDTTWWRGKHGFQVGFFPSECVELINDKVPQSMTNSVPKPVSKKHGKLITFLRSFMKSRPTKQKLKQRGILRERVFGCDLGEHLLNSGHDVPQVLKSCTEFIEKHGVVDGIYRLSGIASNIQKLRHEFDSEQIPDLTKDVYIQDIHCVGSLCKLYFRELPNPLLTYQLYEKFSEAVSAATDEERLIKIHDVIQQLPPPHYRTLEFLMRHLSRLAAFSYITNMHSKNLAIVWAPNLLRSKQIESACFSGTAAFMEVRIQSVVVEFILNHVDVLFSTKLSSLIREGAGHNSLSRPKSLLVSSPSTKLLSLEEAQARTQAQINSPVTEDSKYIEVGEGPAALQGKFHTVIEFPTERSRPPNKSKKSPVGSWRSFFNLGKSSSMSKRKLHRNPSEPNELKAMALAGGRGDTATLRSAKSEESLSSLHNVEGESKVYRPRRPRSSSDALSASFNGELLDSRQHCNSYDNLDGTEDSDGDDGPICVPALISPPRSAGEDVDLSPPDIGMASLDFDPMSFQCSLPDTSYAFPLDDSPVRAEGSTLKRNRGNICGKTNGSDLISASFISSLTSPLSTDTTPYLLPAFSPLLKHLKTFPPVPQSPRALAYSCFNYSSLVFFVFPLGVTTLDSSKDPTPCSLNSTAPSSVPPPPPPKNAARMLALALAESAQQVSTQSQLRSSEPSTPLSPLQPHEASSFQDSPHPFVLQFQTASEDGAGRGSTPPPNSAATSVITVSSHPSTSSPSNKHQPPELTSMITKPSDSAKSSITASQPDVDPPPDTPLYNCAPLSTSPSRSSPTRKSPERQQPVTGPVPLHSSSSNSTAATTPSGNNKESGNLQQHGPEVRISCWLVPRGPSTQIQPPAQTQPHTHSQTLVQPQPHLSKASARVAPTSAEPVEKPWEAIKPVQPCAESGKYHDSYGPTPPAPPVRTIESKLATAALSHSETSYHILGEGPPSGHMEDALPHHPLSPRKSSTHQPAYLYHAKGEPVLIDPPGAAYYHQRSVTLGPQSIPHHYQPDSVPPHTYVSKSEPQIPYSARIDNRYSTLGPRSYHHSIKSRGNPRSVYLAPGPGHQGYSHDRTHGYPTIRRVHSLHVPSSIRSVPIQRTEVPPDDDMFFYHRPVYQCKAYQQPPQQSSQADYHVTQLQPYFENGRVQYRYSPYSGSGPLEAPFYDIDPYGTIRVRHLHSYSGRDAGTLPGRPGGKATGYHYLTRHILPPGKEHSFVSRDMPPGHGSKEVAAYLSWDPEESERLRMHSIRRESRARLKVKGPVLSQYDNVGLFTPADISGYETLHLRSKSDPGKAVLIPSESKDGRYLPRQMVSDPEALMYMETDKHVQGSGVGDKPDALSKQSSSKKCQSSHSLPSALSHSLSHQQESGRHEAKYEPGDDGSRSKHKRNFQARYECPDSDHHQSKVKTSSGFHSTDDQSSAPREQIGRSKPERSHSVREQHYSQAKADLDRDYSCQKHSTKAVQSHYDNLDDYHPVPQPHAPVQKHGASSSYPAPGFPVSHNNRAYSTALGQGAFIQTSLAMQRPETEIHTE